MTCLPVFGPIIAGKFQFSGMCERGRRTRKDHEVIEVYGGANDRSRDWHCANFDLFYDPPLFLIAVLPANLGRVGATRIRRRGPLNLIYLA
jgi:hypothetical protein